MSTTMLALLHTLARRMASVPGDSMKTNRRYVPYLIIGSGIAGCTTALTLADAGLEVLLING